MTIIPIILAFVAVFLFGMTAGVWLARRKLLAAWTEVKCLEEDAERKLQIAESAIAHGDYLATVATWALEGSDRPDPDNGLESVR